MGADLEELRLLHEKILVCPLCHLSKTRKNAVPGVGNPESRIMFIGEGPGGNEDLRGEPFVGRAGAFLDECLQTIGLKRTDVFITNVIKCRAAEVVGDTMKDRRPSEEEISICSPYLNKQIELIAPKLISTLGDVAKTYILSKYGLPDGTMGQTHGRLLSAGPLKIVPLYHPAAALYDPKLRDIILRDFRILAEILRQPDLSRFTG